VMRERRENLTLSEQKVLAISCGVVGSGLRAAGAAGGRSKQRTERYEKKTDTKEGVSA
jgi:hypothetical protein